MIFNLVFVCYSYTVRLCLNRPILGCILSRTGITFQKEKESPPWSEIHPNTLQYSPIQTSHQWVLNSCYLFLFNFLFMCFLELNSIYMVSFYFSVEHGFHNKHDACYLVYQI
jgi:hypothetical protein